MLRRVLVLVIAAMAVRAAAGDRPPDLRALLAKTNHRIFIARLTGLPLPPGPVTRLGSGDGELLKAVAHWLRVKEAYESQLGIRLNSPPDVLRLTFRIESRVWTNMALATAISGDYRGGAEMLEFGSVVYGRGPDGLKMWSDAAGLRIEQYNKEKDIRTLLDALWGMSIRPTAESDFNKGLILEELGLHTAAIESYRRSAARSTDRTWNEEAARRIRSLSEVSRPRAWLEKVDARFSAIIDQFDVTHIDQSLEKLQLLKRDIPASDRVLHAMVDGAIGDCLAERGDLDRALQTYTSAQQAFESSGEPESAARMRVSAAHMLSWLGHPVEAWRTRRPALRIADASGDPELMEFVLTRTASDEIFNRDEARALALYTSVLPLPPLYALPGPSRWTNFWRNPAPFLSKQVMLDSLNGRPLRADVRNDVRFAQGISLCLRKPAEADVLLSETIAFAEATGRVAMLPYVYFYRAMARREAKREDDAIRDLSSAISLLEARRRSTSRRDLRDLWYRIADDAFHELMNTHWSRGDDRAAFATGERRRGLVFLDGVTPATNAVEPLAAQQIAERLEPGTALIVFTASPRYTLATAIEKGRVEMHRIPVPTGQLLDLKTKLRNAIAEDRLPAIHAAADQLHALLIEPLEISSERIKRLVVVPDQPLHDLPFAVLRNAKTARYLIQEFELERVANASVYAQTKQTRLAPLHAVVTVGDPAFDRNAYPSLPPLPAARAEAVAVGREYAQSHVLVGASATFPVLTASVPTADVVHIAAHTAPSEDEQQVLKLVLAPSSRHAGACGVAEVAGLPLKKGSVVVVSGCRTGTSREPGTLRDFAGAFLAGGASNVVATLWDIEDRSSQSFALLFHRALRRCGAAVTATREAQLAMLASSNPKLRNPRAWSGFQVFGVGS